MRSRYRLKLTIVMIVFALLISTALATTDHMRLREQAIDHHQIQIRQNEETVSYALRTIEKAYYLFGEDISAQMEQHSMKLLDLYDATPDFGSWDFQRLKEELGMDVYILNSGNKIIYSSFAQDIGLDFSVCCQKLSQVLTERRLTGSFYDDGIDMEQVTGHLKKYSYTATRDRKYTIQLGYDLEDGEIFKQFNFLKTLKQLQDQYPSINSIRILNTGGFSLGQPAVKSDLTPDRKQAFEHTLHTGQTTELQNRWEDEIATYRYVRYISELDSGTTQFKVIEMIYNDHELAAILRDNRQTFLYQLGIVLLVTVILALILARWAGRWLHIAFHDSLTGLKNRAAFDELLSAAIAEDKESVALAMIDLDNFKLVNDKFGHDQGDWLLKRVAHDIRSALRKRDVAFRLGGDEFVLMMPGCSRLDAEETMARIIESIRQTSLREMPSYGEHITVSIGVAFAPEQALDAEQLCKKADRALYASKEKGKNQYCVYSDELELQQN